MSRLPACLAAASLALACLACDRERSAPTPTLTPSPIAADPAEAPTFEPAVPEPGPLPPEVTPPETIAADLPVPAPADQAALDAVRAAAEQTIASSAGADTALARSGMPSKAQLDLADLLRKVAAFTERKGRIPFRVVHAPLWDEVKAQTEADLDAPDSPGRAARVRAAMTVMIAPEANPYHRAVGYEFLALAMEKRVAAGGDPSADDALRRALMARLPTLEKDEEIRHVHEIIGRTPSALVTPVLVTAGADGRTPAIRQWALRGLLNGVRSGACAPEPAALRAIYRHALPQDVHSALVDVGAALRMDAVSVWCAAEEHLIRSLACRMGLAGMVTEEAFERLYPFVKAQDASPKTQGGPYYGFREDFALLDLYAEQPYARARYYALMKQVLSRVHRNGYATGFILRRLARLNDIARARTMLETYRVAVRAIYGEAPTASNVKFLYAEIDFAAQALDLRAAGKPVPPRTDPWFNEMPGTPKPVAGAGGAN